MSVHLHADFETRSVVDLREHGLHRYAQSPTTEPLCLGYAFGSEEPAIWTRGTELPRRVRVHIAEGGILVAHNAPFELEIWNEICVPRFGWPELRPEQVRCTMAMAYAMGFPGALEDASLALGLDVHKDKEGRALMLKMAKPLTTDPIMWLEDERSLRALYAYCMQDVRVERKLEERLLPLSEKELRVWLMDYRINRRGVRIDRETVKAGILLAERVKTTCDAEMAKVTNGAVQACAALPALKRWCAEQGVAAKSLDKSGIADILARGVAPQVERALRLRLDAGKASTAKLHPMLAIAGRDDRVRNTLQYHGAATGRWAGRKIQPHNFVRDIPDAPVVESILRLVREGNLEAIDMIYGSPLQALSTCMRGLFVPTPGNLLVGGDFSNVEGRGVAWVAGEQWKIDAFNAADAGTGPGIYELTASKILGIKPEQVTRAQRQSHGKVPELALGYQGGEGAFITMGKTYGVTVAPEEARKIKEGWRDGHPATAGVMTAITRDDGEVFYARLGGAWKALQKAAISAVARPGEVVQALVEQDVRFLVKGSFLWCLLPSGRAICYPYPKLLPGEYGLQLTYMKNDPADEKRIDDPMNSSNWARVGTYGGKLMENIVQALCRDLLVDTMLVLDGSGARIVLHVHDEIVIEVPAAKAAGARDAMEKIMRIPPAWAKGFPLWAVCTVMERYGQ